MPELAEVETVRKYLDGKMRGKKVKEVDVDLTDKYLYEFAKPREVKKALEGAKVTGTGRRGKYFWIEFNRKPALIIHLGMSGNVSVKLPRNGKTKKDLAGEHLHIWGGVKLQSEGGTKSEGRPEHLWFCRLLVKMSDGTEIALLDPRRFGRVWLSDDPKLHSRIAKLGYDPLIDFPTAKELHGLLKRRKNAIKAVLLDQSIFAGIGNWLADEVLFNAKLSPHHKAADLDLATITRLRKSILSVVKKAVSVDADYERFPKSWIFHHRWGKSKTAKTSRGDAIRHEEIGGRTSAWVPKIQR
jgi:formamidopyrimidine-DNA glycosylase